MNIIRLKEFLTLTNVKNSLLLVRAPQIDIQQLIFGSLRPHNVFVESHQLSR
jgi:hypothetical protein